MGVHRAQPPTVWLSHLTLTGYTCGTPDVSQSCSMLARLMCERIHYRSADVLTQAGTESGSDAAPLAYLAFRLPAQNVCCSASVNIIRAK